MTTLDGNKGPDRDTYQAIGLATLILAELVGTTGGLTALGWWLTSHFAWPREVILIFAVTGFSLSIFQVYQTSKKRPR